MPLGFGSSPSSATALCLGHASPQPQGHWGGQAPGPAPAWWPGLEGLPELRPVPAAASGWGAFHPPEGVSVLWLQPQEGPWLQVSVAKTLNPTDTELPAASKGGPVSSRRPLGTRSLEHQHFISISDHLHLLMPGGPGQPADGILFLGSPGSWGGRTSPRLSPLQLLPKQPCPSPQSPSQVKTQDSAVPPTPPPGRIDVLL